MRVVTNDSGETLAIVTGEDDFPSKSGVKFLTEDQEPLQVGLLSYEQNEAADAHTHPDRVRTVNRHQEVIHVSEGTLEVEVYGDDKVRYGNLTLMAGQTAVFLRGGRGWTASDDARVLEVKQGPYAGPEDTIRF